MLAIEELTARTCHWPVAEFDRNVFLFCGEAVDPARSPTMRVYCACHGRLAYRRPGDRPTNSARAQGLNASDALSNERFDASATL